MRTEPPRSLSWRRPSPVQPDEPIPRENALPVSPTRPEDVTDSQGPSSTGRSLPGEGEPSPPELTKLPAIAKPRQEFLTGIGGDLTLVDKSVRPASPPVTPPRVPG